MYGISSNIFNIYKSIYNDTYAVYSNFTRDGFTYCHIEIINPSNNNIKLHNQLHSYNIFKEVTDKCQG